MFHLLFDIQNVHRQRYNKVFGFVSSDPVNKSTTYQPVLLFRCLISINIVFVRFGYCDGENNHLFQKIYDGFYFACNKRDFLSMCVCLWCVHIHGRLLYCMLSIFTFTSETKVVKSRNNFPYRYFLINTSRDIFYSILLHNTYYITSIYKYSFNSHRLWKELHQRNDKYYDTRINTKKIFFIFPFFSFYFSPIYLEIILFRLIHAINYFSVNMM